MPAIFEVLKSQNGQMFFHLKAANGQTILASEMYSSKASALNGIDSVKKNASLEDHYDKLTSKNGKFYFTLKAGNSQIVGNSEMYESESSRDRGIQSVMSNAAKADTVDYTVA